MITQYSFPKFNWIDVQSPKTEDLSILREDFGLSYDIINDLAEPLSDTRSTLSGNQMYLTFHVPSLISLYETPKWQEIDIIITEDHLITISYESINALQALRKELEIEVTLKRSLDISLESFLSGLIIKVHTDLRTLIAAINDHQRKIDEQIFDPTSNARYFKIKNSSIQHNERTMVQTISETGRILFSLNQSIAEQRHTLRYMPNHPFHSLQSLKKIWERELEHTADQTKAQYDLYHDLRRTNEELLSSRQNAVMRKLTLIAFITSPLTIVAGLFGMNMGNIPFTDTLYGFWIVMGIMFIVMITSVLILKAKGWFE